MDKYFTFNRFTALALTIVIAICGISVMTAADLSIKSQQTEVSSEPEVSFVSPSAGMSSIVGNYIQTNGEASVDLLSTTAVGMSFSDNKYYTESGDVEGHLIVCTAAEGAVIYEDADSSSIIVGNISQYGVGTMVSETEDWVKIVSDETIGYAQKSLFAYGEEAESLEDKTYRNEAYIDTDELTLRQTRSMQGTALCILAQNSLHEIIDDTDDPEYDPDWTKVNVEGVGEGYILTYYIQVVTNRIYARTVEQQLAIDKEISQGVSEAESREDMWREEQEKLEEEQRQALETTEEEAETAESAANEAAEAAVSGDTETAEEAARKASNAATAARFAASRTSNADYEEACANASAAENAAAEAWESYYAAVEEAEHQAYLNSTAGKRQELVDYACSFAGWLPYVSGGSSLTSGADCSGFVYAIYSAFGYDIPGTSWEQASAGYSVPLSDIQPGDIIIYSGHVAIYVGDGLKVHAPYPGTCVTINSMYYMTILDVRRIID